MGTAGGLCRKVTSDVPLAQSSKPHRASLPLLPDHGSQPAPNPLIQTLQHRGGLTVAEVALPATQVAGQFLRHLWQTHTCVRRVSSRTRCLQRSRAFGAMPSLPGLPLLVFTRRKARFRFSLSQTSSINCSVPAGLWVSQFAVSDSVPSRRGFGASLLPSTVKASTICSWFFCRLSLIESCRLLAAPCCSGLRPCDLLCPLLTPAARSE
jgi:hypothetical protein